MRTSRYWAGLVVAAVALSLLGASCSRPKPQTAVKSDRPVPVSTALTTQEDVPQELSTFGTAKAHSSVSIKAQVSGTLQKVHFLKGQNIRKGQTLYTIDPRPFEAALNQAKANLAKDQAVLANARNLVERTRALLERGAATQDELETRETTAKALEATVQADQAAVETAILQLNHCTIASPVDGKAGDTLVHEGNLVKEKDESLVTINQISPIEVFFTIPQDDLPAVQRQMAKGPLKVHAMPANDDSPGDWGELTFVDNSIDPATGTVVLGATFANKDERLWPGLYVLVTLIVDVKRGVVVAPASAIETGRDGKYVFVAEGHQPNQIAQLRNVVIGRRFDGKIVIEEGLKPGERVVTDGQLRLKPGSKIEDSGERQPQVAKEQPTTGPASPSTQATRPGLTEVSR